MDHLLPIHFAPLQGFTDSVFRNAHEQFFGGIDAYYTPFVRLEHHDFRNKDLRDIHPAHNTVTHLIPQLIASNLEAAERIAQRIAEEGYQEIDINLGCPFPLLAKRHHGSGILPYPNEVKALLEVVHRLPQISFSVKMRLGWEKPEECMQLVECLNALPLRHVAVHPRLGTQQYKGKVDLEGFQAFYEACRHPLLYNGDLLTVNDLHTLPQRFPRLAGLMIGRGLLANPALAWEYHQQEQEVNPAEKYNRMKAFHQSLLTAYSEWYPKQEGIVLKKMQTFWEYLLPEANPKAKKQIKKSTNLTRYNEAVRGLFADIYPLKTTV